MKRREIRWLVGRTGWLVDLSRRSLGWLLRMCCSVHAYISMSNLLFGNVFAKAKNLCILSLGNTFVPSSTNYSMLHLHIGHIYIVGCAYLGAQRTTILINSFNNSVLCTVQPPFKCVVSFYPFA